MLRTAAELGCNISPEQAQELVERVCLQAGDAASKGQVTINGHRAGSSLALQDVNPPTMNLSVPITMPNGDVAAEVSCEVDSVHDSVTYAKVTKGPTTKEEADFLRAQGACAE